MKTSLTRSKSSFALVLTLISFGALARPVAQVTSMKGQVFVISPEGKTRSLQVNERLEEKSEIIVSEGSAITLNDYYDGTYSLVAGTHLKFFDKSVLLKKGKTWIQSLNGKHPLALTTANGLVDYGKGEFIATFDQASSRTQVLVVTGEIEISNVLETNMKYTVSAGTFTLVDPEVENGIPRAPTRVGLSSLNSAVAEFKHVPAAKETPEVSRSIASVEETVPSSDVAPVNKGEIIYIKSKSTPAQRTPASSTGPAHQYWQNKALKKPNKVSSAPIKFYGISDSLKTSETITESPAKDRHPASLKIIPPQEVEKKVGPDLNIEAEFGNSLRKETAQQPKYSKELENLLNDLKSY